MSLFDDDDIVFRKFSNDDDDSGFLVDTDDFYRLSSDYPDVKKKIVVPGDFGDVIVPEELRTPAVNEVQLELVKDLMDEMGPEMCIELAETFLVTETDETSEQKHQKIDLREVYTCPHFDIPKLQVRSIGDLVYDDKEHVLRINGEDICFGEPSDVLDFVQEHMPNRLRDVIEMFKRYESLTFDDFGLDYEEILSKFRSVRSKSRSMDLFSKNDQEEYVERDCLAFRYQLPIEADHLYWLSTDVERPDAPWQLQLVQEIETITVSKLKDLEEGDVVLVNVVKGGAEGASGNFSKLLKLLYDHQAKQGFNVFAEVYHDAKLDSSIRGTPVFKPRKHNLTTVYNLDTEALPLVQHFEAAMPTIIESNNLRNRRFFDPTYTARRKPLFRRPSEVRPYFRGKIRFGDAPQTYKVKSPKPSPLGKKSIDRQEKFARLCRDKDTLQKCRDENWPYLSKAGPFYGRICNNVFEYGDARFVFATIANWASVNHRKMVFKYGEWRVV